ncbi:MAG: pyridoxal-dependent decarboxylase [Thermoanaerobaculia bacterium]|nr:pyridoxal-dependent decarboxylase [Thermoanaerobaculia bacterium]
MIDRPLDEDLERLRREGHAAIDEIVRYFDEIRELPVLSRVDPGETARRLPRSPRATPFGELLERYRDVILPGVTHWNHPRFFAYFSITGSGAGILGELLSATLNLNGMLWKTSPAATEVEEATLEWLAGILGLPTDWFGIINDTASINTFLALAAAREATGLEIRTKGMTGRDDIPRMRIYCSEHAHSSVDKAAVALGLGLEGISRVSADSKLRLDTQALRKAIESDVAEGVKPIAVVPTLGTTSTAAVDPLEEIVGIAGEHEMWVHADAAYGGAVGLLEDHRWIWRGIEEADSVVVNPHKWLFTPIDCSVLYTRRPDLLRETFSLVPEYLKTSEQDVTNYMDYGLQLGRRFRALKLWLVLSYYGVERMAGRVRDHIEYAARLAERLREIDGIDLVSESMSVVAFRVVSRAEGEKSDELTQRLIDFMNGSGRCFVSHTRIENRLVVRIAIGNGRTVWDDVAVVEELVREWLGGIGEPGSRYPRT